VPSCSLLHVALCFGLLSSSRVCFSLSRIDICLFF
jgi:hypothetical protein